MSKVNEFVSFKLIKEVELLSFLKASDEFQEKFLLKQKGFLSRKLLHRGDLWADSILWDSMEDALQAIEDAKKEPSASRYFSFLEPGTSQMAHWEVEKE